MSKVFVDRFVADAKNVNIVTILLQIIGADNQVCQNSGPWDHPGT